MIKNLLNIFFPKVCFGCSHLLSDNERFLCTNCRHDLPVTNYHFENDEAIKKIFYGRVKLEHATAFLHFEKKGIVQQLLHNLKYKGHQDIGIHLGKWFGHEIKSIPKHEDIDIVIPVPLHKKKQQKRGYNQVEKFGKEMAKALGIDYNDSVLIKTTYTKTQVFKNRIARWSSNNEVFSVQNLDLIENKHVLIVDDIITTGATIESCATVLNKAKNVKISVVAIAIAS